MRLQSRLRKHLACDSDNVPAPANAEWVMASHWWHAHVWQRPDYTETRLRRARRPAASRTQLLSLSGIVGDKLGHAIAREWFKGLHIGFARRRLVIQVRQNTHA